jgi:methionine-rich copper-binding protein CopC
MVRFIDLLRGNFSSDSRGRRHRPPVRSLSFESLETRVMFAATGGTLVSPGTPDTVVVPTAPATTSSLWTSSTQPGTVDVGEGAAVNLGIRFTADTNGFITGLKFYKSAANTGIHSASLWTSSGQLLATAVFTNETGSGWQQVIFSSPAGVTAGTTYVASYYAPNGHFSVNRNALSNGFTSGHLRIQPNGGVFQYGSSTAFPTQTYNSSNYWVDVLLNVARPVDTTTPSVTSTNPANGATNVATSATITVSFSEPLNAATVNASTIRLFDGGLQVAASVAYNAANNSVTIAPSAALGNSKTYTISILGGASGVQDVVGNALAQTFTSTFTTTSGVQAIVTNSSLWTTSTMPGTVDVGESAAVNLGVRFTANTTGYITGIRFYKSTANTGTHIGQLWSSSGQLLATATFTNETASGWQQVIFSGPLAITAGTTYIASYLAPNGHFSVNRSAFKSAFISGSLTVPANGGVFQYGSTAAFPTQTNLSSNYWVDVLLATTPPVDTISPSVISTNPVSGAMNIGTSATVTITFSEALDASSVNGSTIRLLDGGTQIAASIVYNATNRTVTIAPTAALGNFRTYTISILGGASGVKDVAGNAMLQTLNSTFTTAEVVTASTNNTAILNAATNAAQLVNNNDLDLAIEAGMSHLSDILDADNNLLPFFSVEALTKSQAKSYGDPVPYRGTPAYMAFDQHLTSNVAGRSLYALLAGASALGSSVDPAVLSAYYSTVLKSLTKPRNGNWSDTSIANQLITGVVSDPSSYGSQTFNITYLFNIGAGIRGALGIATLSADPKATISGYQWSGQQLFENIVYILRKYYVYGGGDIGGTRTYNWETLRYQLGLQGGDQIASTLKAELQGNWSSLLQGYADPFLIDDMVKYYQATGFQPALDLAQELADYSFSQRFPLDYTQVPLNTFTHMFEVVGEMDAYSRLALVTNNVDMMLRVQSRYVALRGKGFSLTGWSPEYYNSGSDVGEINNTAELIETALNFAQFGWTQYYDDVERFTRGMLLPSQLLDTSFVVANKKPANNGQFDIQDRVYGAFGFPAPYGLVSSLKPTSTGAYNTDITGGALATLADIKNGAYHFTGGVHEIDLLFDIKNDDISVTSPYPTGDYLTITTKVAGDMKLRLPSWADRNSVATSLKQQGLQFEVQSNFVLIHNPTVGTAFYVAMPLAYQRQVDVVDGRQIVIDWLGDSVIAMSRMGTPMPFFPTATSTPLMSVPFLSPASVTNQAPLVSAGLDASILWGSTLDLNGFASDDGQPLSASPLAISWSKVSGPGDVLFGNSSLLSTTAQFSDAGTYVLRLTASDGLLTSLDDLTVVVSRPVA